MRHFLRRAKVLRSNPPVKAVGGSNKDISSGTKHRGFLALNNKI